MCVLSCRLGGLEVLGVIFIHIRSLYIMQAGAVLAS